MATAVETIRNTWLSRMASHLIFGIPATLALFGLALVASRRAVRQSDVLGRLRDEQVRRENAEESLRQSQKMNAVGQLTAGIAHDFNNLLTGIGGAIEMMGRRASQPSPEFARFLDLAKTGVSRAATLTQRLLAFSRQQPLQIEAIDANRLVAGMSELLRRTLGEKVRIETVLAGGLWRARADVAQLESAILNLAINGRDAMGNGGTLTIETANAHLDDAYAAANVEVTAGQYVLIAISDTGTGMAPGDDRARLRAVLHHQAARPGHRARAQHDLRLHQADRRASQDLQRARPRHGGEDLPAACPGRCNGCGGGAGPCRSARRAKGRWSWSSRTILWSASSPSRPAASSAAPSTRQATGRRRSRSCEAHDDIALLFTDVGLPGGMNGRQLAATAIERRPGLKVLFTTGYTANAIVHHGVLDPGVNFIGKPFSIAALAAKIKSMGF